MCKLELEVRIEREGESAREEERGMMGEEGMIDKEVDAHNTVLIHIAHHEGSAENSPRRMFYL